MMTPDQKEQLVRLYISAAILIASLCGVWALYKLDAC